MQKMWTCRVKPGELEEEGAPRAWALVFRSGPGEAPLIEFEVWEPYLNTEEKWRQLANPSSFKM